MDIFSSFSEIQKQKTHMFKIFWDPIGYTEKHKDLSLGAREDMGDMESYWDVTEGVKDIKGNKERDRFFRPNYADRHVVGHHRGVLAQVGVPGGVHGHQRGLQGQVVLLGGVHGLHGGLQGHAGEPG
jgi:hypothetical protein